MQSGLKQMSRSKPAKGCGVGGHVVGWQGQLTDGPVNARSRPEGHAMASTHRSFPGRLSRRRPLSAGAATAGAALAGSSAGPAWAAGKPIPTVTHLPNGIRPEGITVGGGPYACLGSTADGSVHHADLRTGQGRTIAPGPGTAAAGLKLDGRGRPTSYCSSTATGCRSPAGHPVRRDRRRTLTRGDRWAPNAEGRCARCAPPLPSARLPPARPDPAAQSSEESSSSVPVSGRGDFGGFGRPPGLSRRYEELSLPSAVACPPGAGPAGPPPSRRRR